jgi:hypothetical protein
MTRILNRKSIQRTTGLLLIMIALIGQCLVASTAFSQADTNSVKPRKDLDSLLYYINPMDYAFMMHEETRWMMKAGIRLTADEVNVIPLKAAFEQRISRSFTLNAAMDHAFPLPPGEYEYVFPIRFSLESRWYYRQNNRLRQENLARNMSDNYIALGVDYSQDLNDMEWNSEIWDDKYLSVYMKWGLQRRYLKHGYTDMGITFGLMDDVNNTFDPFLVLNTYVDMGLCFTKDKYKLDRNKYCAFVKCYEADRFIIKSNLVDLVNIGILKNYKWINLSPQVAFEKKIASSPFSINVEINAMIGYSENYTDPQYYSTYYLAGLDLEGRWYYNLKKNIRNGNTGNGLSANYISAGGSYNYVEDVRNILITETGPQLHLATGWQRLLSKHMYFDLQVGFNYLFKPNRYGDVFQQRIKMALGYRF